MTSPRDPGAYTDTVTAGLPTWLPRLFNIFQGVPFPIWGSIIWEESKFNPNATNISGKDESYGLLQLNRKGGQGRGHSPDELKDPINNALIGSPPIRAAYARYGNNVADVARYSGHPSEDGSTPVSDPRIQRIVRTYNYLNGIQDPFTAIKELLSGVQLPDPSSLFGNPSDIGRGIWEGLAGGLQSFAQGLFAGGSDAFFEKAATPLLAGLGIISLASGIWIAASQNETVQQGAKAATTAVEVAAVA